jgi:tetratricopeptide (TPR) repeat protein
VGGSTNRARPEAVLKTREEIDHSSRSNLTSSPGELLGDVRMQTCSYCDPNMASPGRLRRFWISLTDEKIHRPITALVGVAGFVVALLSAIGGGTWAIYQYTHPKEPSVASNTNAAGKLAPPSENDFAAARQLFEDGQVLWDQGNRELALIKLELARLTFERVPARVDEYDSAQDCLATIYNYQSLSRNWSGNTTEAWAAATHSITVRQNLVKRNPSNDRYQRLLAGSHQTVASFYVNKGDYGSAISEMTKAQGILQALHRRRPTDAETTFALAMSQAYLAFIWQRVGDTKAAAATFSKSIEYSEMLVNRVTFENKWLYQLGDAHDELGRMLLESKNLSAARAHLTIALAIAQKLVERDSANIKYQRALAASFTTMGKIQSGDGQFSQAISSYRAGLAAAERAGALNRDDPFLPAIVAELCLLLSGESAHGVERGEAKNLARHGLEVLDTAARTRPLSPYQQDLKKRLSEVTLD